VPNRKRSVVIPAKAGIQYAAAMAIDRSAVLEYRITRPRG